jgi:hypothetical protein
MVYADFSFLPHSSPADSIPPPRYPAPAPCPALQELLALHDAPLAAHFAAYRGGLAGVVWPHLATLWTELLARSDWLRVGGSGRMGGDFPWRKANAASPRLSGRT